MAVQWIRDKNFLTVSSTHDEKEVHPKKPYYSDAESQYVNLISVSYFLRHLQHSIWYIQKDKEFSVKNSELISGTRVRMKYFTGAQIEQFIGSGASFRCLCDLIALCFDLELIMSDQHCAAEHSGV